MKKSRQSSTRNGKNRPIEHEIILTPNNYKEYFHKLISLDEKSAEMKLKCYNMKKITVILREENIIEVKVPGLAEKRPSVIKSDIVRLKEHYSCLEYVGAVKEVHEKDIWIHQIKPEFIWRMRAYPNRLVDVTFDLQRLTYNRKRAALNICSIEEIANILLPTIETSKPNHIQRFRLTNDQYINSTVRENQQQKQAVMNILNGTSGNAPYIVFGPPGTGKSVTIVEAILQIVRQIPNCTVLVCAPTNAACDVLVEKLSKHFDRDEYKLIRIYSQTADWKNVPDVVKNYSNRSELIYHRIAGRVLQKFKVIVTTLISVGNYAKSFTATHVFIDEASQAMEPEALIAIAGILGKGGQMVLSGDPNQLGPVCNCDEPEGRPLGISLLARLMERPLYTSINKDSHLFITKLILNYRNHPDILYLPNQMFYNSELQAVSNLPIDDQINQIILPMGENQYINAQAIEFYGVDGYESRDKNSPSYYNEFEVDVVIEYLQALTDSRAEVIVQPEEIGVIAPYIKQVLKIRNRLREELKDIEIGTTETFQGREKRVIIISTVRAQTTAVSRIGFLQNPKRFNVAVTRAISKLIIIGNPRSLASCDMWLKMIKFCQKMGSYRGCPFDGTHDTLLNNKFIRFVLLSLVSASIITLYLKYKNS